MAVPEAAEPGGVVFPHVFRFPKLEVAVYAAGEEEGRQFPEGEPKRLVFAGFDGGELILDAACRFIFAERGGGDHLAEQLKQILVEAGGRGEVYREGLASGRSRKPRRAIGKERLHFGGAALRRALGQHVGGERGEALFRRLQQGVAAGVGQVRGNVGQGLVRDEDNGTALAEIDDLGFARFRRLRRGSLGPGLPFLVEDGLHVRHLGVLGRQDYGGQAIGPHPRRQHLPEHIVVHVAEGFDGVPFALIAAHEELEVADLGGKAGQRFLGAVQIVFKVQLGALQLFGGERRSVQRGEILGERSPEGLHLARVKLRHDHERADALKAHVGNADAVHKLALVFIGLVEKAGAVAAEQVGQHVQRGGLVA